jgi:adenylosuccinate synthase
MINALDSVAITKIDVLDVFDEIPFCTGYKYKGSLLKEFPADTAILAAVEPVYKNIRGWKQSIAGKKEWSELPIVAQDYLKFLSDYLETPVSIISTGPGREETIQR